ncbi:uncharacterized protein ChaoS9_325 [Halobacterium phage ChaoS9]|uniref:Uncharacterized protein n=1 Tax=Halobacterium phage ChaoS9 TaxID=2847105 RepID=A0A481V9W9_9CAUD|nr:uncharacterized protein KMC41_gp66 [Halobacterium phage ChaoS9]QBI90070.1 uncharacterized protein ChaoS9_325 [Halobacterium phage ChaoS9]
MSDVDVGDQVRFEKHGKTYEGEVVAIGHSGMLRVACIVYVDIEPEEVLEVVDDAGDVETDGPREEVSG